MRNKFMIIVIIAISLTIIFIIGLYFIGYWLVIEDPLEAVDAIVVISGDQGERVRHGVKLFKNNYANHLIFSGCPGSKSLSCALPMRDQAISLSVPPENIILDILENHSSGTGTQAINVKKIMQKKDFLSAILVTSNFHTRRSKLIFERAFKKADIKLFMSYPENNVFNPKDWWKRKKDRRIVIKEVVKFLWYWFTFWV